MLCKDMILLNLKDLTSVLLSWEVLAGDPVVSFPGGSCCYLRLLHPKPD